MLSCQRASASSSTAPLVVPRRVRASCAVRSRSRHVPQAPAGARAPRRARRRLLRRPDLQARGCGALVALAQQLQHLQEEVDEVQVEVPGGKGVHVNGVLNGPRPTSKGLRGRAKDLLGVVDYDEAEDRRTCPGQSPAQEILCWEEAGNHDQEEESQEHDQNVCAAACEVRLGHDSVDGKSHDKYEGEGEHQQHRLCCKQRADKPHDDAETTGKRS
mmetsp:Transcript_71670/g.231998  ORF Transcript_71670/g.231998 Transcript_71670/m.231998 type:complete len:216 (-) Transcript_71670:533-1180(-)